MDSWIAEAVGKMHINKISNIELGEELSFTPQYVSEILNGKKNPKGIEGKVLSAIDRIVERKKR